jgi:hypothetical protein
MRNLIAASLLVLVACGPTPAASPSAVSQPVIAVDEQGPFRLELELPSMAYAQGEPIEAVARLRFAGPGSIVIAGSGSGLITTSLLDADGTALTGAATADCVPYTIDAATPWTTGFVKSGGYAADDPSDDFVESFLKDPIFRLPAGHWGVEASADFFGEGCDLPQIKLRTRVPIVVTD